MRVPRYGIHNGIKYSPRRTLIRFCEHCGQVYIPNKNVQRYCSEECLHYMKNKITREEHNPNTNFKYNPQHNSNKIYIPPQSEEERIQRNAAWKNWYHNLTLEQKIRYNNKKKRNNKKTEDTHESIRAEMEALGLR